MNTNHNKYKYLTKNESEIVHTFVPTKKDTSVEFRTTKELKKWLKDNYPNGKISAYVESLIYADHQKRSINIYEVKKEYPRLTDEDLIIRKYR